MTYKAGRQGTVVLVRDTEALMQNSCSSKRLDYEEMKMLLDMMFISPDLLAEANDTGESRQAGPFMVRKTGLEELYILVTTYSCT